MKKILLALVATAVALPVLAVGTTTITTTTPDAKTTTTTTVTDPGLPQPPVQRMEEASSALDLPKTGPSKAPAVDGLPSTDLLNQQKMEDPGFRLQDPMIEDESGEFKPTLDKKNEPVDE